MQERMHWELLHRYKCRLIFAISSVMICVLTMVVLLFMVLMESLFPKKSCDQPLQYYIWVSVGFALGSQVLVKFVTRRRGDSGFELTLKQKICVQLVSSCSGFLVTFWGLQMVLACRTCATTNPGLYNAVKRYIMCQIFNTVYFSSLYAVTFKPFFRELVLLNDLERPGCVEQVKTFPHIPHDAKELRDEDGTPLDCAICMEGLDNNQAGAILMTPCDHYFHDSCLFKWCQNHQDCPLCRCHWGDEVATQEV